MDLKEKQMKVLHLGYARRGGAGVAACRLSTALCKLGVDSSFVYLNPHDKSVSPISWFEKKLNGLQNIVLGKVFRVCSINIFPTRVLDVINTSDADVVHLHWMNAEMISIEQIGKIRRPIVWSFHDMWPICGTEHRVDDERYADANYPNSGKISRWVWRRKCKHWQDLNVYVTCPSRFYEKAVKASQLFGSFPVYLLPNCLDLNVFKPMDRSEARRRFGLPYDKKIVVFGACDSANENKGGDLLFKALRLLKTSSVELVIFGADGDEQLAGLPTHWMGRIDSEKEMAALYNTADLVCVPSRHESFGQTASEPQACGIPVVAFDTTGLKDVVDHKKTGYLANPFDVVDFANGIEWVLAADVGELGKQARELCKARFSEAVVAREAVNLYETILNKEKK